MKLGLKINCGTSQIVCAVLCATTLSVDCPGLRERVKITGNQLLPHFLFDKQLQDFLCLMGEGMLVILPCQKRATHHTLFISQNNH